MKNIKIKPTDKPKKTSKEEFIKKKIKIYHEILTNTIISIQSYKTKGIFSVSELNICFNSIEHIFEELNKIEIMCCNSLKNSENIINLLQKINNDISIIFKSFGTKNLQDLLIISMGVNFIIDNEDQHIFNILKKYIHPIGYKTMTYDNLSKKTTSIPKNKIVEDFMIVEKSRNFDCFDLARTSRNFQKKVYGIKVSIHNPKEKKILIVSGLVDDITINCVSDYFIKQKILSLYQNKPKEIEFTTEDYVRFIDSITIKEILIYSNEELYQKYIGYLNQSLLMKQKSISQNIREFINSELYGQRKILIQLLIKYNDPEFQYLAYLLYDLLSNDNNGNVDTVEQSILFDSLPWTIKKYFKDAMKMTIEYTRNLSNFETTNIPLEQQICLLKVSDKIKEKAMVKLKEIKAKSEDSGSKARQYLDGLLKIPFGIFKKEPLLDYISDINEKFKNLSINKVIKKYLPQKDKYNINEISEYNKNIKNNIIPKINNDFIINLKKKMTNVKRDVLVENICFINILIKKNKINTSRLCHSGKKNSYMKTSINDFIEKYKDMQQYMNILSSKCHLTKDSSSTIKENIKYIENKTKLLTNDMTDIKNTLDESVHGHDNAKRQIERIIGQWVNGESNGYCFGFEGAMGIGKCMAKGTPIMLSNGKIKKVENIKVGDKIMGDDSTPRNILALGQGREKMYEIRPVKGDSYTVNESHILSLKMSATGRKGDKHITINGGRYWKNDIVDICIKDYLKLPKSQKIYLKGYRVGVDFPFKKVELDPYILGYWLGDGTSSKPDITTIEEPVIEYFKMYCEELGLLLKEVGNTKITYRMTSGIKGGNMTDNRNTILNMLRQYKVLNNKHIPHIYKCNSKEIRLELLAGLIDSDGSKCGGGYDIIQKNERLLDDIIFLARSLGFAAYKLKCEKSCMYKGEKKTGTYYRTCIHGEGVEYIPVKVLRKKTNKRKQIKNVLNTGIEIIPLEENEYYGFQIDGNSRFLLGDFTVTHNTSLAKNGISKCLKDVEGNPRPFSFIAIGGSCNGSTLSGHNYTYVGSTWGRIVDILMENKCMNPIIFIDELDKVSKTEHGKEIIGILTHLVDATQNDSYQDKYFNGIDLDLSKVLFIFSYNDASAVDKILLDRIHRIKFKNLDIKEKITITSKFLLPEINKKLGLNEDVIIFSDDIVTYIISHYTYEAGVRKLKEILFEICSEINLKILTNELIDLPIIINKELVQLYLKERHEIRFKKILPESRIGVICGLWANAHGKGGIIQIESSLFPSTAFLDLKLTGMQGDVMKESMNVAKTLAWKLTKPGIRKKFLTKIKNSKLQGIHIHCPDGATPKDGPSAGTAITICMFSLFNDVKIKNDIAITGEINLQGNVTAIGGLDLKILGGIRAGIKYFLFPKENQDDFDKFMEKYKNSPTISGIKFKSVETIEQVFLEVFDK